MVLPPDVDEECVALCNAMNRLPGITTIGSCCGHGQDWYSICFVAVSLEHLPDLLYWFDGCHSGEYGWQCVVSTDCGKSPVTFTIEGPIGERAYRGADVIANYIETDYNND
jgi:hypothetical protein